jgi:hypothetical protein
VPGRRVAVGVEGHRDDGGVPSPHGVQREAVVHVVAAGGDPELDQVGGVVRVPLEVRGVDDVADRRGLGARSGAVGVGAPVVVEVVLVEVLAARERLRPADEQRRGPEGRRVVLQLRGRGGGA